MGRNESVTAWRPAVPGVAEVFHARFVDHAYPSHTHDAWTVLIVDDGAIRYDLDRAGHDADGPVVTVLPPGVPHDGRAAVRTGFRKRVLYLDVDVLGADLVGAAVDAPTIRDPVLRRRVHQLDRALTTSGEEFEAAGRLALVAGRLRDQLRRDLRERTYADSGLAGRFRALLDANLTGGLTLAGAAAELDTGPARLIRAFTSQYGLPPHRYLTGRRIEAARRLLLAGRPPAEVATAVGFYDQAHLNRHFTRYLGTTPARYAPRAREPA